jgi:glutamyl-tRNA synthetase
LLRNDDRSKISKRKNPAARLTWFREQGYLPEALVNFLGLMGYSMPDEREVFTFAEMSAEFDWSRVNVVGPIFNLDKLNWLNGHYIRALPVEDLADRIVNQLVLAGTIGAQPTTEQREMIQAATPLVQERMQVLAEAPDMLGFLLAADEDLAVDDDARKALSADAGATLAAARRALAAVPEWTTAGIEAALRAALVDGLGLKPRLAFTPLRVAVTGRRISPPLFESMELLGRVSTLARVEALADDLALVPPATD